MFACSSRATRRWALRLVLGVRRQYTVYGRRIYTYGDYYAFVFTGFFLSACNILWAGIDDPSRRLMKGGVVAITTFILQSSRDAVVKSAFTADGIALGGNRFSGCQELLARKSEESKRTRGVSVIQLQGNVFFANVQQVCS